ncbi:MAG: RNA polymerase sigma factor [bacterium]
METSESQIISQCQKGSLEQFAKLYDRYVKAIYTFIYYKTMHKETAEDLASQTFIKAMDKIKTFKSSKGSFKSWLYRIARNTVIDHYRAQKTTCTEMIWDLSDQQSVIQQVDDKITLDKISHYLESMSKQQREIIIMRLWDGLSYEEIAEITGLSKDNSRMLVSRGLKKVKQSIIISFSLIIISAILWNRL